MGVSKVSPSLYRRRLGCGVSINSMSLPVTRYDMGARIARRSISLNYPWWRLGVGLVLVLLIAVVAGGLGSVYIPPWTVAKVVVDGLPFVEMSGSWPDSWGTIIWNLRFPRIVLAGLVGAALAVSGATYQGLFRNPLGRPVFHRSGSRRCLGRDNSPYDQRTRLL